MSSQISPKTPSKVQTKRIVIVFTVLFFLFFITLIAGIYIGSANGEIEKKIVQPLKKVQSYIAEMYKEPPASTVDVLWVPSMLDPTATPSAVPTVVQQQNTYQEPIYYYQSQPVYPTPIPGRPGSKEWEEEFWRVWDEMGKSNAENQRKVEEAQKRFCEENSTLCSY